MIPAFLLGDGTWRETIIPEAHWPASQVYAGGKAKGHNSKWKVQAKTCGYPLTHPNTHRHTGIHLLLEMEPLAQYLPIAQGQIKQVSCFNVQRNVLKAKKIK